MARHDDLKMSGEVSLFIDAPPDLLYQMVSDVTRMGEWSPETSPAGFRARVGKEPIDVARRMVEARREALVASMRTTLDNLKRVAEESRP